MIRVRQVETDEEFEAYIVSKKNLEEVAAWCNGTNSVDAMTKKDIVIVPTRIYPIRAYIGDVVLRRDRPKGPEFFMKDMTMFNLFFEEV